MECCRKILYNQKTQMIIALEPIRDNCVFCMNIKTDRPGFDPISKQFAVYGDIIVSVKSFLVPTDKKNPISSPLA